MDVRMLAAEAEDIWVEMILMGMRDKNIELFLHRETGKTSAPEIKYEHVGFCFDGKPAVSDTIDDHHKPMYLLSLCPVISYHADAGLSRANDRRRVNSRRF